MFIISLSYKKPIEDVEQHLAGHIEWLKKCYADGLFLASGRKVPRTGGVIFARGERAALEALCRNDPFFVNEIADYDFTEVDFTTVAEGFEALKD